MNIVRTALVAGMLGSVAMPALAQPVQAGNDAPYSVGAIAPRGDHPMARGPQGRQTLDDRHGPEMGPPHGPALWMVAGKLAAAEVALGITPDQQDAWRVVTSAVIKMAEAGP